MKTLAWISSLTIATLAHAAPTRVGNGDEGTDLEGAVEIKAGPIVEARAAAAALVKRLQLEGVSGLGNLLPELERAPLYLAKKDSVASLPEDQGAFHSDLKGRVYARTFAEPHAATRFFPAAEKLDQEQLVSLHLHEALHRALAPEVREDESVVSQMTLAISAPDGSRDRVASVAQRLLPVEEPTPQAGSLASGGAAGASVVDAPPIPEHSRVKNPSQFGYAFRNFQAPKGLSTYPVERMHLIRSDLYFAGDDRHPIGIGIEGSLIGLKDRTISGPLGLSGRVRAWSGRGFDIGFWGSASLNTLSAEELKTSPMGRDVLTVGLSVRKDLRFLYVENQLGYSLSGENKSKVGPYEYTYKYGGITNASIRVGGRVGFIELGGVAEMNLADNFEVQGSGFKYETGRYRVISGGPEASLRFKDFGASVAWRQMWNASKDVDFDTLGNLMGPGVGQGNVTVSASVFF